MVFLIQSKVSVEKLLLVRATSRIDAFNIAKIVDVPKRVWELENFDSTDMDKTIVHIDLR